MSENCNQANNSLVQFSTLQRRLRHLKAVCVRNIQYAGQSSSDVTANQLYFTLHTHLQNIEFYRSEKINSSVNPSWKTFNLEHLPLVKVNTTAPFFVVKIWKGKEGHFSPFIVWEVNLSGLTSVDTKVQKECVFPPNTLMFFLHNGFYMAPPEQDSLVSTVEKNYVEKSLVKNMYSISTLSRVQTMLRAIKQNEASGTNFKMLIEKKLTQAKIQNIKKAKIEDLKTRVKQLHEDLESRTKKLHKEKTKYEQRQTANTQRDMARRQKSEALRNDRVRLQERKKKYFDMREDLIKNGAQLVMKRKQLISELSFIYPIRELPNGMTSIAGITLPMATEYQGYNDVMLEVSLGHTCHLVHMISYLLDMPLRYPMQYRGSKSLVKDHIVDKLQEKDRSFPLFLKGREKFQFEYGVYLLNKNIAQLRFYCGLGTTDLRHSLANLKSLLTLRLGVKYDRLDSNKRVKELFHNFKFPDNISKDSSLLSSHSKDSSQGIGVQSVPKSINQLYVAEADTGPKLTPEQKIYSYHATHARPVHRTTIDHSRPLPAGVPSHVIEEDLFRSSDEDSFFTPSQKCMSSELSEGVHTTPSSSNNDSVLSMPHHPRVVQHVAQDCDRSSSEDSASLVYRAGMWPKMLNAMCEQDDNIYSPATFSTVAGSRLQQNEANSDSEAEVTLAEEAMEVTDNHSATPMFNSCRENQH